jgi:F0F1-type ATP synthase epsilon subunit
MEGGKVIVLVQDALSADQISEEKALDAQKKAEEIIEKGIKGGELSQAQQALRRSLVDLKIIRRRKLRVRQ